MSLRTFIVLRLVPPNNKQVILMSLVHVQEGMSHCYIQIFGVSAYAEV